MKKTKAFHLINRCQIKGALKVAKSINKDNALDVQQGRHGIGAYAHYYKNINRYKGDPIVIFLVGTKRITNISSDPIDYIMMRPEKGEFSVSIEIVKFINISGI